MQTSTPQRSFSVLPGPNQYFQNYENEPTSDGLQSHSTRTNINVISDGTIIPESSEVAARKRRPPAENVQPFTSIQERKRKTKPNSKIHGSTNAADLIEIDNNHVDDSESITNLNLMRISTRSRNIKEDENNRVRRFLKNSYFGDVTSEDSSCLFEENKQITVEVDVHRIDKSTPINLANLVPATASISSADKLPKVTTATTTATVDKSRLTHRHSRTTKVRNENHIIQNTNSSYDTANDSSSLLNNVEVSKRLSEEANNQQIDSITISSASFNIAPIPSKDIQATTASNSNEHRLTKAKTKVAFNTSCLVHEKSTSSANTSKENEKNVMKGGKWRRTIVEIRKNKSSQCKFIVWLIKFSNENVYEFL